MDASSSLQPESSKNRITINVGGFRHETHLNTLLNIPDTRLSWIVEHQNVFDSERRDYFFDRHPGAFAQVLNYFRTGKLHCPTDMCGPMFEEELAFWGIDEKQMEPCCWAKYTQHREAEENLKAFVGPGFETEVQENDMRRSTSSLLLGFDKESCWEKLKPKVWLYLDKPHSSKLAKLVSYLSCFFISLSIATFCISTLPEMKAKTFHRVGNDRALNKVETVCSIFFTLEFIMRFLFCPSKFKFIKTPMNWLDFLAIIPFYIHLFVENDIVRMFLVIRVFRLVRFIKLSYGLQIMIHTLKASSHELVLLLLILLILVVLFSSIVYYIEVIMHGEDSTFTSVPISFWWCLITMTTVGYGDMTPQTWPGKIMGGACAVCGVLVVALPISVIGSNFNLYYAHAQARLKLPMKQKHLVLGGVPGLVTKHQELSSRRKKKTAFPSSQQSEQSEEQSPIQGSPVSDVKRKPDPLNDKVYHDSIPLIQTEEDGSSAGVAPGLSRRRPRRTTATLLPMMQLQAETENRNADTDTSQELSPTHTSRDTDPQLINRCSQELDSNSPTSSLASYPAHAPTGTPRNGSLDYTTSDDRLAAQFGSEEALSNVRDVPSLRRSKSPSSGADGSPTEDDHLTRPGVWRRKSLSDSKLFSMPDKVLPDQPGSVSEEANPTLSDKCVNTDMQPVGNGTTDPLGYRTRDKSTLRTPASRGKNNALIGNGTSPMASKEGPPESRPRTTTHPKVRDKSAVVYSGLSANGTEDILETNI